MGDELLFCKYDLKRIIESQRERLRKELDAMQDGQLLTSDIGELRSWAVANYTIEIPELKEPVVDQCRTKMEVGRYGGFSIGNDQTVLVDAQSFTLEVPFEGDRELFFTRGSTFTFSPPRGHVGDGLLTTTIVERNPSSEALNQQFDHFLAEIRQHLGWLKSDVDSWNASIAGEVDKVVEYRRQKSEQAGAVAGGLKFGIKQRSDRATTYAMPVAQRRKIVHQLPPSRPSSPPEPVLASEMYRAILDVLKQMAQVMERSPHAYATMDEETLRFQFLVPLNANFEGEARAEVFNYGGKTDILISAQGRNIFVGECKFWSGAKALAETVDQVLSYLAWRDTKCAILLFNRNRNFSQVLAQIEPALTKHPHFVSFDGARDETEFAFTFRHPDDHDRRLKLAILAFDIPAEKG